jgi:hypothetical protein
MNYHLYEDGNIGMCNALMSVENALIIALLTNVNVNFIHSGKIFNSEKKLTIFDLYDFEHDISHNLPIKNLYKLQFDFHNTVICKDTYPTKEFMNGRKVVMNLNKFSEFETLNSNTLAFYSYLFCLSNDEKIKVFNFVKDKIKPKEKYNSVAMNIVKELYPFNCINPRRGDYLYIPNNKNGVVKSDDFLPVMKYHFDTKKVLIVSDETDKSYFSSLSNKFDLRFIQDYIPKDFDTAERGLIALIVASHSSEFIGTLKSTFSAIIQRYRKFNGFNENFKFLYSQQDDLILDKGRMIEKSGSFSWSRVQIPDSLKTISFWMREWEECYN